MEVDQLTVTLKMLAEGQQQLADILSQLDKLPAERTVKINVESSNPSGGVTGAADSVNSAVDSMNKSIETMPAVAEQTSSKVSSSMGKSGLSGAFSETKGNLNSLTGGMMGFLPIMAGFSLVSAVGQFDDMAKSVQAFKVASGTTAQVASDWVGVAGIYGLNANTLGQAIKGLQTKQEALETTFSKTGSNVASSTTAVSRAIAEYGKGSQEAVDAENAVVETRNKVVMANNAYDVATQKVTTDQEKLTAAISKYGAGTTQAQTAEQALETAQSHRLATQDGVLSAQQNYQKATGSTTAALSTTQLAEQRLGINLLNNKGQMVSSTTILTEMADAYTKTGGSAQTVADITTILGGRAKAILPLFAEGSAGITAAIKQTQAAGGEMTQQQLTVGVAAGKTMADIKANIKNMFVSLGSDLVPVFQFVDQHVNGIMDIAKAVLLIFLTVKAIKFATGFISDISKLVSGFKTALGFANTVKNGVAGLTGGGSNGVGKIIGAQVTVAVFGGAAFDQLKMVGGMGGGGGLPGGPVGKDLEEGAGSTGILGFLGKIPGIGGLFGGAAAGTAEAGGLSIGGMAGGIGVGATAGVFAAALAPIAAMFLAAQGTGKQSNGQYKSDTGPTSGVFAIPGLTTATSVGNNAFQTFFDAVHKNTTTTTIMGRKITSVSDNMHDVQGKADMSKFFANVSDMKGFSGMTAQQEQALATAVQNGTVGSEADLETWLANNGIISTSSTTAATNSTAFANQMITLQQTATQSGPSLVNNIANLAAELKSTAGNLNNLPDEAWGISELYKSHKITTSAQMEAVEAMYTTVANATNGSATASMWLSDQLTSGAIPIGADVSSFGSIWKQMTANGGTASIAMYNLLQKIAAAEATMTAWTVPVQTAIGTTTGNAQNLKNKRYGAKGGLLNEYIIGIGQKTGTEYHIGEAGDEALIPLSGGMGGGTGSPLPALPLSGGSGGGGGGGTIVNISFPNSLTFLNNANQIDELAKAIETRLATVRLPHRGVRMSPHASTWQNPVDHRSTLMLHFANRSLGIANADRTADYA